MANMDRNGPKSLNLGGEWWGLVGDRKTHPLLDGSTENKGYNLL